MVIRKKMQIVANLMHNWCSGVTAAQSNKSSDLFNCLLFLSVGLSGCKNVIINSRNPCALLQVHSAVVNIVKKENFFLTFFVGKKKKKKKCVWIILNSQCYLKLYQILQKRCDGGMCPSVELWVDWCWQYTDIRLVSIIFVPKRETYCQIKR